MNAEELIEEIERVCQSDFCPDCREVRHMIGAWREGNDITRQNAKKVSDDVFQMIANITKNYKTINGIKEAI
jgi:hypothetical protein